MIKLLRVFLEADLRCSHEGLAKIAKDNKINVDNITPGECVIFINSSRNRLKLYAANNIIAYLRLQPKQILDFRTISLIPAAFNASGRLDYDKALKTLIEGKVQNGQRRKIDP